MGHNKVNITDKERAGKLKVETFINQLNTIAPAILYAAFRSRTPHRSTLKNISGINLAVQLSTVYTVPAPGWVDKRIKDKSRSDILYLRGNRTKG